MAPLKVLLAAANGNATADVKTICSDDAVIVDEVPPHRWNGASAAYDWLAALKSQFKDGRVTGAHAVFQKASVYDHSGARAWIVLPTTWTGTQAGRRFEERGFWSFLVVQSKRTWKIDAASWTDTELRYL